MNTISMNLHFSTLKIELISIGTRVFRRNMNFFTLNERAKKNPTMLVGPYFIILKRLLNV